ncbi:hypothetical protein [Phormidium nigroviride]
MEGRRKKEEGRRKKEEGCSSLGEKEEDIHSQLFSHLYFTFN